MLNPSELTVRYAMKWPLVSFSEHRRGYKTFDTRVFLHKYPPQQQEKKPEYIKCLTGTGSNIKIRNENEKRQTMENEIDITGDGVDC